MLWVALQTSIPAAEAKTYSLLPACKVKACANYQSLEDIDEQCRRLCVNKPGTVCFYALHVTMNGT